MPQAALQGVVQATGVNDLGNLASLQNTAADLNEVTLSNDGLLHGSGILKSSLSNQSGGELRTLSADWARFEGIGNVNAGEINNLSGVVDFARDAANTSTGFIGGRGLFVADGGWTNEGVMAFSGTTNLLGDINNLAGGTIVTSGGATTTFFDDVVHNGSEIRTSAGGSSVFFGDVTGAGNFTGTGIVFFEGDLRPGNSPDIVSFDGSVVIGSGANSFFELAGLDSGSFDQLLIDRDLALDGQLTIDLIDGFQLTAGDEFLIADVAGDLSGQFFGLGEGDLVGRFGRTNLFISYTAGNGNDVGLFASAVPEPGACGLLALACLGLALRRRRF